MKKTLLLLFFCLNLTLIYSQQQADTIKSCCSKDTLSGTGETGLEASFPGGSPAYFRWLRKSINSMEKLLSARRLQGNCLFKFLIDTTGRILEIQFCSMNGTLGETVVREIFAASPLWRPAISDKRGKVSVWFCQNISFTYGRIDD